MKKTTIPLLIMLAVLALSCEKQQVTTDCLKAKVVRVTCANTVIQVLNDSSIGQDGWKDIYAQDSTYDNVFAASNSCKIPSEYKVGDVFYITIAKPSAGDCIKCALYDAPPEVSYEVKTMGSLPCNDRVKE